MMEIDDSETECVSENASLTEATNFTDYSLKKRTSYVPKDGGLTSEVVGLLEKWPYFEMEDVSRLLF